MVRSQKIWYYTVASGEKVPVIRPYHPRLEARASVWSASLVLLVLQQAECEVKCLHAGNKAKLPRDVTWKRCVVARHLCEGGYRQSTNQTAEQEDKRISPRPG
eukprot:g29630.t1